MERGCTAYEVFNDTSSLLFVHFRWHERHVQAVAAASVRISLRNRVYSGVNRRATVVGSATKQFSEALTSPSMRLPSIDGLVKLVAVWQNRRSHVIPIEAFR